MKIFLAGGIIGSIAGIMSAPGKGSNTRRKLGNIIREFRGIFTKEESEKCDC